MFLVCKTYYKDIIFPRLIYSFNTITINTPRYFIVEIEVLILEFTWKHKVLSTEGNLKKENELEDLYYQISRLLYIYSN